MLSRTIHFLGNISVCSSIKATQRTVHTASSRRKFLDLSFLKYFQRHKESIRANKTPEPPTELTQREPDKIEKSKKGQYEVVGGGRRNNLAPLEISSWMNSSPITTTPEIVEVLELIVRQNNPEATDWQTVSLDDFSMKFKVAVQASEQIGRRIPDQVLTRVKDVKALIKFYTTPEKKKSRYLVIDEAILDGTNIRVVENRRKARI